MLNRMRPLAELTQYYKEGLKTFGMRDTLYKKVTNLDIDDIEHERSR